VWSSHAIPWTRSKLRPIPRPKFADSKPPAIPPLIDPNLQWNPRDVTPLIRAFCKEEKAGFDGIETNRRESRSLSDRHKPPSLALVQQLISPVRDAEVPFWPMCGEAISGHNAGQAISSSIFAFPWIHHLHLGLGEDEEKLAKIMKESSVSAGKKEPWTLVNPFDRLTPGRAAQATLLPSTSTLQMVERPDKPRRPSLAPSALTHLKWVDHRKRKGIILKRKRESDDPGLREEDRIGSASDERQDKFSKAKVVVAAERRSLTITSRSIGITNWESRMGFMRRGRALGELD
jgi:hypothetical protein